MMARAAGTPKASAIHPTLKNPIGPVPFLVKQGLIKTPGKVSDYAVELKR